MSATLTTLRDRVEAFLQDGTNLIFETGTLDEALRLALSDYSLTLGTVQTISGLDGAAVTSVPALHESVLVIGAAGYAVVSRAIRRAESYQAHQELPKPVLTWGQARLDQFSRLLEQIRLGTFRVSTVTPWVATGWKMDDWDGA